MAFPNPIGSKIELTGVANYKAISEQVANAELLKEVLDSFTVLKTQPQDWTTKWTDYYEKTEEGFVKLATKTAPTFVAYTYYSKKSE